MEKTFNLPKMQKKGAGKALVITLIFVVIGLVLLSNLAPVALVDLFNTTKYCTDFNCSVEQLTPTWVITTLGIIGAVAFIFIILKMID